MHSNMENCVFVSKFVLAHHCKIPIWRAEHHLTLIYHPTVLNETVKGNSVIEKNKLHYIFSLLSTISLSLDLLFFAHGLLFSWQFHWAWIYYSLLTAFCFPGNTIDTTVANYDNLKIYLILTTSIVWIQHHYQNILWFGVFDIACLVTASSYTVLFSVEYSNHCDHTLFQSHTCSIDCGYPEVCV